MTEHSQYCVIRNARGQEMVEAPVKPGEFPRLSLFLGFRVLEIWAGFGFRL